MTTDGNRARAVVIGGSMAGLLAARVLADLYAEVTVIDRDHLPTSPEHRRGVPQAHHAHALLARGQQTLEELFPGITAELAARGAPTGDMLADAHLHFSGYRLRQAKSGVVLVSASRILLEDEVRRRVRELSGITFAPPSEVVGLTTERGGKRINGVRVLRRTDGSAAEVHDADLVVDAAGRGSRAPAWLETLGCGRPEEDRVCMDLYYTSRRYRLAPDALGGDLASVQAATPTNPRAGALARLEGNQWLLTLAGILGDRPPTDADGFLAFARSLSFPDIYEAIREGEPLDEPVTFRFRESVRRRYERLTLPDGFLPFGDSFCSFNPIYGQGMTVAALQALVLKRHLQTPRRAADPPDSPRLRTRRRGALGDGARRRPGISRRPGTQVPVAAPARQLRRAAPRCCRARRATRDRLRARVRDGGRARGAAAPERGAARALAPLS